MKALLARITTAVAAFFGHYTGAFAAIMVVTLGSTLFSISYLSSLETRLQDVWDNDVRGGDAVQAAQVALVEAESALKDLMLWPDEGTRSRARGDVKTAKAALVKAMTQASPRFYTPKAKAALKKTQADLEDYYRALDQASSTLTPDTARPVWNRFQNQSDLVAADLKLLVANRSANSAQGVGDLVDHLGFSLLVTVVLLILTVTVRIILYITNHPKGKAQTQEKSSRTE